MAAVRRIYDSHPTPGVPAQSSRPARARKPRGSLHASGRRSRVDARAGGARDGQSGPHPTAQPQRLPAALGRRGAPLRPGRGQPAADAAHRDLRHRPHPDLRHPLPRRPLPRAARRDPAALARPGAAPGGRPLPRRRRGLLRPAAPRGELLRDRRAGRRADRGRRAADHPGDRHAGGPPAAAPDRDVRLPPGRAGRLPDAAGEAGRVRHRRSGGRRVAPRRPPGPGRTSRHPGRGEREPGRGSGSRS